LEEFDDVDCAWEQSAVEAEVKEFFDTDVPVLA